jgi:hypothetical protein
MGLLYGSKPYAGKNRMRCMIGGKFGVHEGTGHKKEESKRSKLHRARCPKQRAVQWGHLHSGGEVTHRPILRREGKRTRITRRKGLSGSISGVIYSKVKSMLEKE